MLNNDLTFAVELPTAEELMRPIRPEQDDVRGFTLQPVRSGFILL